MVNLRCIRTPALVMTCLFAGCQYSPEQVPAKPVAQVTTSTPTSATKPSTKQQAIQRLLADADYALSQDRLLMPIEDNAFDRFQSVLLMEPDNKAARTGLQSLALRYIEMARTSMARGQFSQAQSFIDNARGIDPQSPLLAETTASLRKARAAQPAPAAYKPGPNEHLLDGEALNRKSPAILAHLTALAQKAKDSGDLVIIYARNDAEGRWIYAQMREALGDFLLRGDIRVASQPRVQFVPVL